MRLPTLLFVLLSLTVARADTLAPRVNHVALYVVDFQASTDFYAQVIGLPAIPEPFHDGKHSWFAIGPQCALHVIGGADAKLPKEKHSHLCFTVDSVAAFAARLTARGIPYEDLAGTKSAVTHRPDGVDQIYFQDPDDNWIEINDAKE